MKPFAQLWNGWLLWIILFSAAVTCANLIHYVVFLVLRRHQRSQLEANHWRFARHLSRPARWVCIIACTLAVLPFLPLPKTLLAVVRQGLSLLLVATIGWLCIGCIYLAEEATIRLYDAASEDNVTARRVRTQTQVLRRIAITLIVVLDAGAMLWTFHDARLLNYGTGLIASAGVASFLLATATKSTVGNILAGLQIALTQPIRIGDVVIVEGEWGKIEEITTAYVVVKIWDLRRLIVPLSYWIEHPFQNWTRDTTALLGSALIYVDYSLSIDLLREHHTTILQSTPLWDRRLNSVQMTNCTDRTVEVRCLSSARNSSDLFDLRCIVREEMIKFIQRYYPQALPQTRIATIGASVKGTDGQRLNGEA
jgi:small-conductance mechanosensitive channel